MEKTTVADLYEAAWLLINGCALEEVECVKLSGRPACRLTFSGIGIPALQEEYFSKQAAVNLFSFRQGYNQINSFVSRAKKNYAERERALLKEARRAGGEE